MNIEFDDIYTIITANIDSYMNNQYWQHIYTNNSFVKKMVIEGYDEIEAIIICISINIYIAANI